MDAKTFFTASLDDQMDALLEDAGRWIDDGFWSTPEINRFRGRCRAVARRLGLSTLEIMQEAVRAAREMRS